MIGAEKHEFLVLAYGGSPFLDDCLRSLKGQSLSSRIRISTSTPNAAIERAAEAHGVELLVNPVRSGIGRDWNYALERSERRYVTLAHQDDVYRRDFTAATLGAFAGSARGALAFTSHDQIDDAGAPTRSRISVAKHALERLFLGDAREIAARRMRWFLSFGNPLPCSSVTLDRGRLGGFRFSEAFASNLDWDAWLRLCGEDVRFLHIPKRLVGRRHNAMTETSRLIRDGRRRREDLEMFRRTLARPFTEAVAYVYSAAY